MCSTFLASSLAILSALAEERGPVADARLADGRPAWVETRPRPDDGYLYYVGRSSGAPNEKLAIEDAREDARRAAILENFPVTTQVARARHSSLRISEEELRATTTERSERVRLERFEQVGEHLERPGDGTVLAYLLFRYSRDSLARERERLAHMGPEPEHPSVFDGLLSQGPVVEELLVESTPPGARITIDGEPWAATPVRIVRRLAPGRRSIRMDHPAFEIVEETVELTEGSRHALRRILKPARASLILKSDPTGAAVRINGESRGETPLALSDLPAGVPLAIRADHPEAEPVLFEVTLQRGESREIQTPFVFRPSTLRVDEIPEGVIAEFDGERLVMGKDIAVKRGSGRLVTRMSGYEAEVRELTLRRGVRYRIARVEAPATPVRAPAMARSESESSGRTERTHLAWTLLQVEHQGSTFSNLSLSLDSGLARDVGSERIRVTPFLGFQGGSWKLAGRFQASFGGGSQKYRVPESGEEITIRNVAFDMTIGLPYYFNGIGSGPFLGPQFGMHWVELDPPGYSMSDGFMFLQFSAGVQGGWMFRGPADSGARDLGVELTVGAHYFSADLMGQASGAWAVSAGVGLVLLR